jgi:hypothetical protein
MKIRARIRQLAKRGKQPADIAAAVDRSVSWVYRVLREEGLAAVRRGPLDDRLRVVKLVNRIGAIEAAKQLGVSRQAVYLRIAQWAKAE